MPQCMCGCTDCRGCHPENFEAVGGRSVYVGDMTPEERKALEEDDANWELDALEDAHST
jgi:hypothetical protein